MSCQINSADKNMSRKNVSEPDGIKWIFPFEFPIRLSGFAFYGIDKIYRRLPMSSKELFKKVNDCLNFLSDNTSGGQLAFRTNSTKISVKVKLKLAHNMVNMAATGQDGFDCYIGQNGERLKFYGVTNFDIKSTEYECEIVSGLSGETNDVLLNFPLYEGVCDVQVGIDKDALILPPKEFFDDKKIVFYGTSITQGGCASRPGMAYTNILSRWLNRECYNYGFSGNGLGEYEMAQILAEVENPAIYVLDYEANAGTNGRLEASLEGFIEILREKHKDVPILVVSRIPYLADFYDEKLFARRNELREFQRSIVEKRKSNGDKNIFFLNGHDLFDENFDEYTVDFIHPTDLGFWKIAEGMFPLLKKILEGRA